MSDDKTKLYWGSGEAGYSILNPMSIGSPLVGNSIAPLTYGLGYPHLGGIWGSTTAPGLVHAIDGSATVLNKTAAATYGLGYPHLGGIWGSTTAPGLVHTTNSLASVLSKAVPITYGVDNPNLGPAWASMTAIAPSAQAMRFDLGRGDEDGRRLDAIQAAAESAEGSARRLCAIADRVESETLPAIRRFMALDEFFRNSTIELNNKVLDIQKNVTQSTSHLKEAVDELRGSSKIAIVAIVITAVVTIFSAVFSTYLGNKTSNQYSELLRQQLDILSKIKKMQEDENRRQKELNNYKSQSGSNTQGMQIKSLRRNDNLAKNQTGR